MLTNFPLALPNVSKFTWNVANPRYEKREVLLFRHTTFHCMYGVHMGKCLLFFFFNKKASKILENHQCPAMVGKAPTHQVSKSKSLVRLRILHSVKGCTLQGTRTPASWYTDHPEITVEQKIGRSNCLYLCYPSFAKIKYSMIQAIRTLKTGTKKRAP